MRAGAITAAVVCLVGALLACACGSEISDQDRKRSNRYYQAAHIAWLEERDNLAAIRHLTRSIEANQDNDNAHYLLGTIRLGRGEFGQAEPHLRKTVALRGKDRPASRTEALNSLGVLLILTERVDEAITVLTESAEEVLNREPWLAMGNLGWAYIEGGDYDKAIEVLRRAMFDQPRFCVGMFRLGQAYYHKGEYESAEAQLKAAITVEEDGCGQMQETHHLLGMTLLRLGREEEAIEAFERCHEINPTSEMGVGCAETNSGL
ncbi:MAG: tetratricopeptide repeat protein [Deltaproteobacteria bacterium]|nr:tetratricopeptide repeat protein [Deltaproteobacteria bacterium]